MTVHPPAPDARVTHIRCAFGGTGVSAPGEIAIVAYFELDARVPIAGVHVVDVEIRDPSGAVVARALPPIDVRRSLPGRDENHNLRTEPFAGAMAAGTSVRLCAAAHLTPLAPLAPLANAQREGLRYRASIRAVPAVGEAGETLVVEGPLDDPWATAGPARA